MLIIFYVATCSFLYILSEISWLSRKTLDLRAFSKDCRLILLPIYYLRSELWYAAEILLKIDPIPPFGNGVAHQQSNRETQHTTRQAALPIPTRENRNAAFFMPSCHAVGAERALLYGALRARFWPGKGNIPFPSKTASYRVTIHSKGVMKLWQFSAWKRTKVIRLWATTIYATRNFP